MARHRRLHNANRQRRTRPLAQTQAQRQERLLAQGGEQAAMRAFGREVACDGMIQGGRHDAVQHKRGGAGDKTV